MPIKEDNEYLEPIPASKQHNYWRFGVREIAKPTYERILSKAHIKDYVLSLPKEDQELESFQPLEGGKKVRFSAYYERNLFYRRQAIDLHGLRCMACEFDFQEKYGELGKGFIHVHHTKPISESGPRRINPQTEMIVVCPNCHAMIHRKKTQTLSLEELRYLIRKK